MTPIQSRRYRGFSLVELMVAMVIGMLAILVVLQVYSSFEDQKRATTSGSEAENNGAIALYAIQRDVANAGFGLPVANTGYTAFHCPLTSTIDPDGAGPMPAMSLSPMEIDDDVGGATSPDSDMVIVRSGAGMFNVSATVSNITGVSGNQVMVNNALGCALNGIVLFINGSSACASAQLTAATPSSATVTALPTNGSIAVGAGMVCLGAPTSSGAPGAWNEIAYAVDSSTNQLVSCTDCGDPQPAVSANAPWVPVASDVVNLQAQYGISSNGASDTITQWVNATGSWSRANMTLAQRNQIKAIRIAVVTRNDQYERNPVPNSVSCATLNGSITAQSGVCAWTGTATSPAPAIDLTVDPNWQHYRYKVYTTIIPLRSMIWSGVS